MTADQIEKLQELQRLLGIRKDVWGIFALFRRGGIYPTGAYYLDRPGNPSDTATVWLDWSKRQRFLELIQYLREAEIVEYYRDCSVGDSGDGHHGINPWHIPGDLMQENVVFLAFEATESMADL